jgi:hypothetical protein
MKQQLEKVSPIIELEFKKHPNFYKIYKEESKLIIAFSDMAMGVTPVGWDIYFVEVHDKPNPTSRKLLYAKICKNKEELMEMLHEGREHFIKPPPAESRETTHFAVDIKHLLKERLSNHPKFEKILEGYKKLFLTFDDILIIVEAIGGTFYNWELYKREGSIMVIHKDAGAKIGFDRIVDQVVGLRKEVDDNPI